MMAKRMREQSEENRIVAKSRPMVMNLTSSDRWTVRLRREAQGYSKLQVDRLDYQGGLMQAQIKIPIPTQRRVLEVGKEMLNCSSAQGRTTKDVQENPKIPEGSEDSKLKSRIWPHHFLISPDCVPHMEKVLSIVRKIYDRKATDDLKDLDVNTAVG